MGRFTLEQAQTIDEAERDCGSCLWRTSGLSHFATLTVNETQADDIRHGRRLLGVTLPDRTTALLEQTGSFLALYRQEGPDAVAEAVSL